MAVLVLRGMIPLNLAITGQEFKLASRPGSAVIADGGLVTYPEVIEMNNGAQRAALKARIDEADISDGVCLSLVLTFPILGAFTIGLQTTGETRLTGLGAHVDSLEAAGTELNPETTDGKPAELDMSNVERSGYVNIDASELEDLSGGRAGTLGLSVPGLLKVFDLHIAGLTATIGTLSISGIELPRISSGRGAGNGECF